MKNSIHVLTAISVIGISQTLCAAPAVLKWTGAGEDWKFSTAANWTGDVTKFSDGTDGVALDLTDVPDGSVLTNDFNAAGSCCLAKITLTAGRTVRLSSGGGAKTSGYLRLLKNCTLELPAGAELEWDMDYPNNWQDGQSYMDAASSSEINVKGGGLLRLTANVFCPYRRLFDIEANTTFAWDSPAAAGSGMEQTVVRLTDATARLDLNRDMRVEAVRVWADGATIRLNGHVLSILSGDQGIYQNPSANLNRTPVLGVVSGDGSLSFAGGALSQLRHALSEQSMLVIANAAVDATYGNVAMALPESVTLSVTGTGRFNVYRDQTVGGLSGEGINGGIIMAANKTLTVNGGGTFGARIAGGSDFVKSASGTTLTLNGRNTYSGATRIQAGTLAVDSGKPTKRGAALHLGFEDSSSIMADTAFGAGVFAMKQPSQDPAGDPQWPAVCVDGISGCGATFSKASKAYYELPASSWPVLAYTNGHPFTVSFWMRLDPDNKYQSGMNYLLENGNWNAYRHFWVYLWQTGDIGFGYGDWNDVAQQTANGLHVQTALPAGYLSDGDWHQVVMTYEDRAMKIYVDVTNVVAKTLSQPLAIPNAILKIGGSGTAAYMPDCDLDELYICDRAWSAAEVAADSRREVEDLALDLPTPVAHWDFNDSSNPGKDIGPNGLTMSRVDKQAYYCLAEKGAFGKAVSMSPSTFADGYPEAFPSGSTAFTVSIRFRALAADDTYSYSYFGWGDNTIPNGFLQLNLRGSPRRDCIAYASGNVVSVTLADGHHTMVNDEGGWTHLTVTYDPLVKELKCYREGTLVATKSNLALTIAARKLYLGANANGYVNANTHFDDVQIYDRALRADQVKLLVRALETGRADPVLPATSPVVVSAGAKLAVSGDTHVFDSLSGAGEVVLSSGAAFRLAQGNAFAGSVSGNGLVRLASGASLKSAQTVSSDVRVEEDVVAAFADLPLAVTTGDAWMPARATFSLAGMPLGPGFYPIVDAGRVHLAGGVENWTLIDCPAGARAKIIVKDGVPGVKVGGGMVLLFR